MIMDYQLWATGASRPGSGYATEYMKVLLYMVTLRVAKYC